MNTHFTMDEVWYVVDDLDAAAVFVDTSMTELGHGSMPIRVAIGARPTLAGASRTGGGRRR